MQPHTNGRWPANVVLVHGTGCRSIGHRKVERGGGIKQVNLGTKTGSVYGTYGELATPQYGGADGLETIAAYECEPVCPVPLIDEKSGELKTNPGTVTTTMASMGFHGGSGSSREVRADRGGASRFFPQFADEGELLLWIQRLMGAPECDLKDGRGPLKAETTLAYKNRLR